MRLIHFWKALVWTMCIGFLLSLGASMPVGREDMQIALVVSGLASCGLTAKAKSPIATNHTDSFSDNSLT